MQGTGQPDWGALSFGLILAIAVLGRTFVCFRHKESVYGAYGTDCAKGKLTIESDYITTELALLTRDVSAAVITGSAATYEQAILDIDLKGCLDNLSKFYADYNQLEAGPRAIASAMRFEGYAWVVFIASVGLALLPFGLPTVSVPDVLRIAAGAVGVGVLVIVIALMSRQNRVRNHLADVLTTYRTRGVLDG